ncbi:hypothetical protein FYC62_09465 [Pedobacter aquae]|uniref:G8 domain-containing protein n=1 Tax=Pedobacter aquae TaxID=2605747 RepID=A0A5C0VGI3_9SPHI|nr:hypothetical protein [Pedobacter aquae]QEK51848.1 hypothetical protein FYC62_09465 [Pedobacter aquae]
MKISTRKFKFMKLNFMAILLMMSISFTAFGQTTIPARLTGDYVSTAVGGAWNSTSTWTRVGGAAVNANGPQAGDNVHIIGGSTVTITAPNTTTAFTVSCRNLYIEANGKLESGSSGAVAYVTATGATQGNVSSVTYNVLRVGVNLQTDSTASRIINNGTIGSGNNIDAALDIRDMIDIHVYNSNNSTNTSFVPNSTFTFSGNGKTKIVGLAAFGAQTGTSPNIINHTRTLTINLNNTTNPLLIAGQFSNGARSLTLNRLGNNSINENHIMNINTTVTVRDNGSSVAKTCLKLVAFSLTKQTDQLGRTIK